MDARPYTLNPNPGRADIAVLLMCAMFREGWFDAQHAGSYSPTLEAASRLQNKVQRCADCGHGQCLQRA